MRPAEVFRARHSGAWVCAGALREVRPGLFGSLFVQVARGVPRLPQTAHGGDGGAQVGVCVSSNGSEAVCVTAAPALLFGP